MSGAFSTESVTIKIIRKETKSFRDRLSIEFRFKEHSEAIILVCCRGLAAIGKVKEKPWTINKFLFLELSIWLQPFKCFVHWYGRPMPASQSSGN